jgi:D-cysteine desulfhydrase
MIDYLSDAFPRLAARVPKLPLADLPTPFEVGTVSVGARTIRVAIKRDDLTAGLYGGNKVRKLEYLLQRARDRGARRVATFGTVASHHALATALYALAQRFECMCFLSHQLNTPQAAIVLNRHLQIGTDVVRYGGSRQERVATLREHLAGRDTWVIPMGGTTWLGVLGHVNAGLELADQLTSAAVDAPDRLYVPNGTMGTAAGLALGLALCGMQTEIQAVRVVPDYIANPRALRRLLAKTATLMHRFDSSIPADLAEKTRLRFRDEFFGGGYAHTDPVTDAAIEIARDQLGLTLEATYSGKAMAALLHDARQPQLADQTLLFWNTHNSRPMPTITARPGNAAQLPDEFRRYFD